MAVRFPFIVLLFTLLLGASIYMLHLFHYVTPVNEPYARWGALGLFVVSVLLLGLLQARHHRFSLEDVYKNDTFIKVALTLLLSSIFLAPIVSRYATGVLVLACLLHLLYTRKLYAPPKFFYFLIGYAFLLFLGTIGTQKGFRFPDKIISFYVLPLAFCCFRMSEKTLLKIGEIFFKTGMIFFVVALSYWWYNFLHLDADFLDWLSLKMNYPVQITGWEHQARILRYSLGNTLTKDVELHYPAYFFINSWSYLYHPTTNSIVLLGSLISASFLYFQKNRVCTVTGLGLGLYAAFCLLAILLMQSRIGTVGFLLIASITGLYYLKRKTKYFKIAWLVSALLAGTILILINDRGSRFSGDSVREAYRRIAIGYIHDHLWWGTGFDEQRPALKAQAEEMKDTLPETVYPHSTIEISHVHNQFLGNMVQFGIWGLIALIAMYAAIAYYAIKNRSYLLLTFLAFIFLFMWVEEGEFVLILIFTLFFTAITEAVRQYKNTHR